MVDDQEEGWISNAEERERAERLRSKADRGEDLSPTEKGQLGAYESRHSTQHERREAMREGRGEEFAKEHRVDSWMAGDETRTPTLGQDTKEELARIEEKQERGEELTRHEAGVLGGAARVREEADG